MNDSKFYLFCKKIWPFFVRFIWFVWFIWLPCKHILLLLKNIFKILFSIGVQRLANRKQCVAEIYLVKHSDTVIWNLLITLNQIIDHAFQSGSEIGRCSIYLHKSNKFDKLADVFSCFQLSPPIKYFEFIWVSEFSNQHLDELRYYSNMDEDITCNWLAFVDSKLIITQPDNYIHGKYQLSLDVPISTKIWARNILKSHSPLSFFVAIDCGVLKKESLPQWRHFFLESWRDFPEIHFILFDDFIALQRAFLTGLPNVTVTKILGYNFLEEFALCQLSDMFMGPYDKYAMAFIGSDKPFLLMGLNGYDRKRGGWEKAGDMNQQTRNLWQSWLFDVPAPSELYEVFSQLYTNVRKQDNFKG